MLKNVLFDLDGTLTDSQGGVIQCFQFTIKELGQPYWSESDIKKLIGIPIRSIFQEVLNSNDNDLIDKAIIIYRKRFSEIGIINNKIYPGILDLITILHKKSCRLYIVTLKNKIDAEKVAKHFSFDQFIQDIRGPNLNEYPENKTQLIKSVITDFALIPEETMMIGDRKEDIVSGKFNNTRTIGVTYGYGNEQEIINVNPDFVCNSPFEIQQAIMTLIN